MRLECSGGRDVRGGVRDRRVAGRAQAPAAVPAKAVFDAAAAARFADLALACVHQEYPNKIAHVLNGDADVEAPARADAGLLRLLRLALVGARPLAAGAPRAAVPRRAVRARAPAPRWRAASPRSTSQAEARYLAGPGRTSFERPYGLAWLLQLAAELREWQDPQAQQWAAALRPLETASAARLKEWLPKLSRPIRIGEHDQTAFAFGLVLDWARTAGDQAMIDLHRRRRRGSSTATTAPVPLNYEPYGQDFLSACIAEADLMRRVLAPPAYADWLRAFLPQIPADGSAAWLEPVVVTDPERSEAGASRRAESQPRVDAGRHRARPARVGRPARVAAGCGRPAPGGRSEGRHRRALRGRDTGSGASRSTCRADGACRAAPDSSSCGSPPVTRGRPWVAEPLSCQCWSAAWACRASHSAHQIADLPHERLVAIDDRFRRLAVVVEARL